MSDEELLSKMPKSWLALRRICLNYLSKERWLVIVIAERKFDFCQLAVEELKKNDCPEELNPFPLVFNRLGVIFHLPK